MKSLQESILDDENEVMDNIKDSTIKDTILKYNDSMEYGPKKGCDGAYVKLKEGDWVLLTDLGKFLIGQIYNFNKKKDRCNIVIHKEDTLEGLQRIAEKDIFKWRTCDLLKVDPIKALEFLKNPF